MAKTNTILWIEIIQNWSGTINNIKSTIIHHLIPSHEGICCAHQTFILSFVLIFQKYFQLVAKSVLHIWRNVSNNTCSTKSHNVSVILIGSYNSHAWFDRYAAISQMIISSILPPLGTVYDESNSFPWVCWHRFLMRRGCDQSVCVAKWGVECIFKCVALRHYLISNTIPQILEIVEGAYPQVLSEMMTTHNPLWKVPDKPPAVFYLMYYSQHSGGQIHCLQSICLCCLLTHPCNPGSFIQKIVQQNYSTPRENLFIWMYFLAKLWLSCDIQHLTLLTFNSNSLCLVGAWSCVSPEQECALSGTDLILFVKPCHWATMEMHASS